MRYGCSRTRSHSPAPSGPRLSQIAFETPSRPRSCTSPARRSVVSSSGSPCSTAARAASSATACAWPSMYGDFRSTKFAIASSAASKRLALERDGERRLGVDHGVPRDDRVEAVEQRGRLGVDEVAEGRVELAAATFPDERPRALDAADAVRDLDELGELREPRRERDRLAAAARRASPSRPTARRPRRARRARRRTARAARRARGPSRRGDRSCCSPRGGPRAGSRARSGSGGAAGSRLRSDAGPTWPCARCAARGRTSRPSSRCRRRTTSPARARRCGTRR